MLLLVFVAVPIAEIFVIIKVGQAIGALWTILLLIADSVIGARLVAWQGRNAWLRFQQAVTAGRVPHNEILDGVLIVLGGALLLTPGFITDVLGLVLLLPPTRALVRRAVVRSIRRRGAVTRAVFFAQPSARRRPPSERPPPSELPR